MSKVDCSNILNYKKELSRMCSKSGCSYCELKNMHCGDLNKITQEHIYIVQKWSNEHQQMTRKEKFIKMCNENGFEDVIKTYGEFLCSKGCCGCVSDSCEKCQEYWNATIECK